MAQDVLVNPKDGHAASARRGVPEGRLTARWRARLRRFMQRIVPPGLPHERQVWLDSPEAIDRFYQDLDDPAKDFGDVEYVCVTEAMVDVYDVIEFFARMRRRLPPRARVAYSNFNWLLMPLFRIGGLLGLSRNRPFGNFFRNDDIDAFVEMAGWENIRRYQRFLLPVHVPVASWLLDGILARLPVFRLFALNTLFVARMRPEQPGEHCTTSVLIPCKNEEDNVEAAVRRVPDFGRQVELVLINDQSTDATEDRIRQAQAQHPERTIRLARGPGRGKAEAVRAGMAAATGDLCMILDADLTVVPEDLPQFYEAMRARRADFIHGTRFVYPQEQGAMRFANLLGNVFFSVLFSYIVDARTTDTLCGTKVYWRRDWPLFEAMRTNLEGKDLWGDYNLIFGAARYGLKIAQLPVRYFERVAGVSKMTKRARNGLIMLRVCWHGLWTVKFFW